MKRKYPVIDVARTGQNIKQIMRQKGLNVKDIQEFLGLSTSQSIYHWFDGRNLPTIDNLYALSALFQMPVDALLRGDRKYKFRCQSEMYQSEMYQRNMYQRVFTYYERFMEFKAG